MKPVPFDYARPRTLEEAIAYLGAEETVILAGGQSLVPLLNLRLARPRLVVDVNDIAGLNRVEVSSSELRIGATARLARLEDDRLLAHALPLLPEVIRSVAHREIRHRSTLGGSLCHLDPAAELPALASLLEAELEVTSRAGTRSLPFADFAAGAFSHSLPAGELLTAVRLPLPPVGSAAFEEITRRPGDFALAGAMALAWREDGQLRVRVTVFGCSPLPVRAGELEAAVASGSNPLDELDLIDRVLEPSADVHTTAGHRRVLARIAVRRCLERCLGSLPEAA